MNPRIAAVAPASSPAVVSEEVGSVRQVHITGEHQRMPCVGTSGLKVVGDIPHARTALRDECGRKLHRNEDILSGRDFAAEDRRIGGSREVLDLGELTDGGSGRRARARVVHGFAASVARGLREVAARDPRDGFARPEGPLTLRRERLPDVGGERRLDV